MAASEFRMYPVRLFKQRGFVALSPTAKATYFVVRGQLPSFGLGQVILDSLPPLVGCSSAEFFAALGELSPDWLDVDGDLVRLKGCDEAMNWGSPQFQKYLRRSLALLPESRLIEEFWADQAERTLKRREMEPERAEVGSKAIPARRATAKALPQSMRRTARAPTSDTVSIQKEREVEKQESLHGDKKVKGAGSRLSSPVELQTASPTLNPYDALIQEACGEPIASFSRQELNELRKLEERDGQHAVLMRLGRLARFVARDQLTVTELVTRWDELGGDNPAPF